MFNPSYPELVPSPVALVTGANKGIGFAVAKQLAAGGVLVWIGARNEERGRQAAEELTRQGYKARFVALDVTDPSTVTSAAKTIEEESGRLDILVNNAGVFLEFDFSAEGEMGYVLPSVLDEDRLRRTYETNVFGVFHTTRAMLPLLRKSAAGRVVNISSCLGSSTLRNQADWEFYQANALAYCSSKAALNGLTIGYAKELASTKIKVNSIDPGYCSTDSTGHSSPRSAAQGAAVAVTLATLSEDGPSSGFFDENGPLPW